MLHARGIDVTGGDARAFVHGELQARLRPFVARRASPNDVDDVLQEIFLRVQRGLPDLRDDQRFGPWVYQVARNAIADQRRVRARHPLSAEAPPEEAAPVSDGEERSAEQLLAQAVIPFIATLPSPYREALTLTELEGLTQKQAAEMLGVSLTGMKSRVQRGRARLRTLLEDCCEIALDARGRVIECTPRAGRKPPCEC
jgi:RNA polymerase sigma-70 factor (ECF subfamily)